MNEEILLTTFTRLKQKFKYLASRFLNDEEDVEDQLQETFCRLWLRKDQIRSSSEAEALIVTTVRHLCIDELRKRETIQKYQEQNGTDANHQEGPLVDIEAQYDARDRLHVIELLIAQQLTSTQQQIIRMKEYEDKSMEQISRELGLSPEAIRMQLSRARKTIRTCYQKLNEA